MNKEYHTGNRKRLYEGLKSNSLLVLFSGTELRTTNDEYYPFYTDRNFYYLTGLDSKEFVLLAMKDSSGSVEERIYILPPDPMQERWTGVRIKPAEADIDRPAHRFLRRAQSEYPFLRIENANILIRRLRTIKQPCEIEAIRKAETITRDGIVAMMKASRPGMYEYQYKAEFDRALGQHSPQGPAFPSIISAGKNNFCIHYYSYKGQAQDGDMILNDVGAQYDSLMTDVSRGWPCNGRYSEKQRLLYTCALNTSNHMFEIIRPGMKMADVDATIRRFNAEQLKDAGVLDSVENIGTYMWHGGAHHVGYDVHDVVEVPEVIAPGMVFCVDVGIYHEEWGIGFRLEDNCLVTEDGCENLSVITPRTIEEIEDTMCKGIR